VKDRASRYFDPKATDEERAIFEGAIALASLYHRLLGTPVRKDAEAIAALERAMELSSLNQPFKKRVKVRIDKEKIASTEDVYGYRELEPRMFELEVDTEYGSARATVGMKWIDELNYPLMYIKKLSRR
jgi:hypothetical protein